MTAYADRSPDCRELKAASSLERAYLKGGYAAVANGRRSCVTQDEKYRFTELLQGLSSDFT